MAIPHHDAFAPGASEAILTTVVGVVGFVALILWSAAFCWALISILKWVG
jgi:hypothetical protein